MGRTGGGGITVTIAPWLWKWTGRQKYIPGTDLRYRDNGPGKPIILEQFIDGAVIDQRVLASSSGKTPMTGVLVHWHRGDNAELQFRVEPRVYWDRCDKHIPDS